MGDPFGSFDHTSAFAREIVCCHNHATCVAPALPSQAEEIDPCWFSSNLSGRAAVLLSTVHGIMICTPYTVLVSELDYQDSFSYLLSILG